MMKYRLNRSDAHNWTIEEWVEEGVFKSGKRQGQVKPAGWKVRGYYGQLCGAASDMVNKLAGDAALEGASILRAIESAREAVLEAVANLEPPNA